MAPRTDPGVQFCAPGSSVVLASAMQWAIPCSEVGSCCPALHCPARVSFASCVLPSSPSPCTWLSHALSTTLDTTPLRHPAGFPFHDTPPPTCSAFQLLRLGSGIILCRGFPLRVSIPVCLTSAFPQPGTKGTSQVLRRISSYMPQPEDSGGPPHPHHIGCFVLASGALKPWPSAMAISKLYQLSGSAVTPTACRILCVRFACLVRQG